MSFADRGFTGHEHLVEFGLIDMNGRVYDPMLGRFLSPDPYVQLPGYADNFNRYSYCLNNPLVYTDPSGEFIWFVVGGAIIGGWIGASTTAEDGFSLNPNNWGDDWWKGAIVGGVIGAGAGALAATTFGGAATQAMIWGAPGNGVSLGWSITTSSLTSANLQMATTGLFSGGDLDLMWKSGVNGLISGAITGGVNKMINPIRNSLGFFEGAGIHGLTGGTTSFIEGKINGLNDEDLFYHTLKGAGFSAMMGGLQEGVSARLDGKSFWTGEFQKRDNYGQRFCTGQIFRDKTILPKLESNFALTTGIPLGKNNKLMIPIFGWDFNKNPSWRSLHWPPYLKEFPILTFGMFWLQN